MAKVCFIELLYYYSLIDGFIFFLEITDLSFGY